MAEISLQQQEQEAIQQYLTVDNKGWNRCLFSDSNDELSGLQCKTCSNICRDPSVIDCREHKDDEIGDVMHCHQCLTDFIQRNNNKCPVNGHKNPTIRRIKLMLNVIHKKNVFCPFSTHFKNIMSDQNEVVQQVHDTPYDDQKEGANPNEHTQIDCNWKGSLKQLITEHFTKCIRVNRPTFVLEMENKSLFMQNQSLTAEIKIFKQRHEEKIKALNEKISALQPVQMERDALKTETETLKNRISTMQMQQQQYEENITKLELKIMNLEKIMNVKALQETEEKKDIRNDNEIKQILHMERSKASVYRLSSAKYKNHFIQDGAVYAIQCDGKYISYATWFVDAGFCEASSRYKLQDSCFKFIKGPQENTWFIQNVYEDSRVNYWLSYTKSKWSLYQQELKRALWRLLPCPQPMEFKIECIFNGKVIGWSWKKKGDFHIDLSQNKYSQFKLQQK